jgi:flagellar biosynthesis/type III secretory pathway chaperone
MLNNTNDLRELIVNEITKLQSGESNPARLRAIVGGASVILKSKQLDIDFEKYAADAEVRDIAAVNLRAQRE